MIKIGPITIMSTKTRDAYRVLANKAYALHQTVWFADIPFNGKVQQQIKDEDAELSEALSHTPASDIDS